MDDNRETALNTTHIQMIEYVAKLEKKVAELTKEKALLQDRLDDAYENEDLSAWLPPITITAK
ncbi:hypothetical protein M0R04_07250 [Candidatus Dojkabacteria bacterium]|jgi:hypothetical protein|nr:hypothetical protein [Candidatus Dojkabacteria bacterium]